MFKLFVACAVLACAFGAVLCEDDGPNKMGHDKIGKDIPIDIAQGKLIGEWRTSFDGKLYGAFEGIPFARSPVGKRRFRDPQRAKKWYGVWIAKKLPNVCAQWFDDLETGEHSVVGNEDCLYLNVYSPQPSNAASLPVVVYIHGGAFIFGSGISYREKFIIDTNVVYVSLNYRLGILGFLSTQDKNLPGNLGLKDQNMALRWIRDNIHQFGGNPRSVTISGMSAGGASVHYHMLSPMSKGLFHKAISMSGSSLCAWTVQEAPLEKALAVGNALGCPTSCTKDMIDCLRHRPVAKIVSSITLFMPFHHAPFSPFAPVVEPFNGKENFLSNHPYEIMRKGLAQDLPWILSTTTEEGLYPGAIYVKDPKFLQQISSKWDSYVSSIFDFNYTLPLKKHLEASKKIKEYYFNGRDFSEELFPKLVDAISDRLFKNCVEQAARLQAKFAKQPVYYYLFSYRGACSLSDYLSDTKRNFGVSHGDDTGYVLKTDYMDPTTTPGDISMMKLMTKMWAAFAKDGKPYVDAKWTPMCKSDELHYLNIIGPEEMMMKTLIPSKEDPFAFWGSLGLRENEMFRSGESKDEL